MAQLLAENAAEVLFGASGVGTIVVCKIKVRDPVVKGREAELLHVLIWGSISEVVPEAERDGGKQEPAVSAARIAHGPVTCFRCLIHMDSSCMDDFLYIS